MSSKVAWEFGLIVHYRAVFFIPTIAYVDGDGFWSIQASFLLFSLALRRTQKNGV